VGRARLHPAQQRSVERGDADADGAARAGVQLTEHVDVAPDHRVLGYDGGGGAASGKCLQHAAGDAVATFDGLVGVHDGADVDGFAPPPRTAQLVAQHRGGVDLHEDMALEVGAAIHLEGDVRGTGVAVFTWVLITVTRHWPRSCWSTSTAPDSAGIAGDERKVRLPHAPSLDPCPAIPQHALALRSGVSSPHEHLLRTAHRGQSLPTHLR
jgi:hypothetical protein